MREIKFRAFVEPNSGIPPYMNHDPEFHGEINDIFALNGVKPANQLGSKITYLQYAGISDKHGVEIYEGDILQIEIRNYATGQVIASGTSVVEFQNSSFGVRWGNNKEFTRFDGFSNTTFEVIGNIYENPDLLK